MTAPGVLVIEAGTLTPCCERVPVPAGDGRFVCAGCGCLFVSARSVIETVFGPCASA